MSRIVKTKATIKSTDSPAEAPKKRISRVQEDDPAKKKTPSKGVPGIKPKVSSQVTSHVRAGEKVSTAGIRKQPSISDKVPLKKPIKIELKTTTKSSNKSLPLKAKPIPGLSKNNVMSQVHNVTVSSPPSQRKMPEIPEIVHLPRDRTRTRTLDPEEIVVLKNKPQPEPETPSDEIDSSISEPVKPAVAFEVNFEDEKPKESIKERKKNSPEEQEYNYEDDFESYESDFESETSSRAESKSIELSEGEKSDSTEESLESSTPTTSPEIHQSSKDEERKLDSGNYELHIQRERSPLDNIEEQNDSGVTFGEEIVSGLRREVAKNSRGDELMKKISLDIMTFSLFELKPIPYDYYMKVYGQGNTAQISTQTDNNELDQDTQTEENETESIWTQCPPTFSKEILHGGMGLSYHEEQMGVGRDTRRTQQFSNLNQISLHHIDYESLNQFLQKSAVAVASIVQKKLEGKTLKASTIPSSTGYYNLSLDHEIFKNYQISRIFTDREIPNVLVTVHHLHDAAQEPLSFAHLMGVWNILDPKYPMKILTSWNRAKDTDVVILCTDFEATAEGYFVATNKPFILFFNKSPTRDNIIKIPVEETHSKFYPTIIEMCPSRENLLIGFSDGSVKLKPIVVEEEGASGGSSEVKVTDEEVEENNLSAKSCAIQNIVKNERKLYHDSQALNNLDSSEMTKTYASPLNDLQRRELRVEGTVL
uniref:Uncharacterized protein n=1 Tax=Phlebotomus papatasi TaxID=29031 RepID=A0A1B0DDE8_PHLPP